MGISLWFKISSGLRVNKKRKLWFTIVPGLAFKAVTFGRKRKLWFRETEYMTIYRFDIHKKNQCYVAWIPESQLIERTE